MTAFENFTGYLVSIGRTALTAQTYEYELNGFSKWYLDTTGKAWDGLRLYRENCIDYRAYLLAIKKRSAVSVNKAISAFRAYTEYLQSCGYDQQDVLRRSDFVRIQSSSASLAKASEQDVRRFIQDILENESRRDYTLVVLLAYTGLRISEALDIQVGDYNTTTREIIIRSGKRGKQRIVYMSDKVADAINEYTAEAKPTGYLFESRLGGRLDRTGVNKLFNRHSAVITPHQLRHYFCTRAIQHMSVHEVASLAGHSNIHTTLRYTNPDKEDLKRKLNQL